METPQPGLDEESLLRTISAVNEEELLAWTSTIAEEQLVKTGEKLAKATRKLVSESLARCRERDERSGRPRMILWETPEYRIIQSTT